jgi:hypothetical protein
MNTKYVSLLAATYIRHKIIFVQQYSYIVYSNNHLNNAHTAHCYISIATTFTRTRNNTTLHVHYHVTS